MSTTTFQRWTIATLALLGILWLDLRFGHAIALSTMLGLMLVVAVYGGSGRGYGRRSGAAAPETAGPEGVVSDAAVSDAANSETAGTRPTAAGATGPEAEGSPSTRAGGPATGDAESGR